MCPFGRFIKARSAERLFAVMPRRGSSVIDGVDSLLRRGKQRVQIFTMKKYFSIFFAVALVNFAPSAFSQDHEEDHTPLEEEMDVLKKEWRHVRRALNDPAKFADAAKRVERMIVHAKKSIELEPILLAEQEGEEAKKAFMEGYQKGMKYTVKMLGELKGAFEAGDAELATELVGKLNDARKKGHQKYKPQDED